MDGVLLTCCSRHVDDENRSDLAAWAEHSAEALIKQVITHCRNGRERYVDSHHGRACVACRHLEFCAQDALPRDGTNQRFTLALQRRHYESCRNSTVLETATAAIRQ